MLYHSLLSKAQALVLRLGSRIKLEIALPPQDTIAQAHVPTVLFLPHTATEHSPACGCPYWTRGDCGTLSLPGLGYQCQRQSESLLAPLLSQYGCKGSLPGCQRGVVLPYRTLGCLLLSKASSPISYHLTHPMTSRVTCVLH